MQITIYGSALLLFAFISLCNWARAFKQFETNFIPLYQKFAWCQSLVKIGPVVLERMILKSLPISLLSPIRIGCDPSSEWTLFQKMFYNAKFGWNLPSGSRKKILKVLYYFNVIFPSINKDQPFNLTNLISLDPRMHCANFVWNWQRGSGEHYWTSSKNFYYFAIIFIWKWVRLFIWIICFSAFTFVGLSSVLIRRKCEKFTGNNDKDRQPTNFHQKSSRVLKLHLAYLPNFFPFESEY